MSPSRQPHAILKPTALLSGVLMVCAPAWSANEQIRDLAGRLEYAFYAEDSRALQADLKTLVTLELDAESDTVRQQQLNYGRWKLAQLLGQSNAALAQQAAQECADSKLNDKSGSSSMAIQSALHAACLAVLEQLRPLRSVLYKRERETALSQALKSGGRLPQVQLVANWLKLNSKEVQDVASLNNLVAAYDAAALNETADSVLWGHAEACVLLGQAEIAAGDFLAARNALERALLLAPDYQAAQVLLRSLTVK